MKKAIAATLALTLFTSSSFASTDTSMQLNLEKDTSILEIDASDMTCANAYQEKFSRIEKNRDWRTAGQVALITVAAAGGVAGGIAVAGGVGAYVLACAWTVGLVYPISTGGIAWATYEKLDHEQSLKQAYGTILASKLDLGVLKIQYHDAVLALKVADQNTARKTLGLPPLTAEEIEVISTTIGYSEHARTDIDRALILMGQPRTDSNYENLRAEIEELSKTDAFCPIKAHKNRPVTYRRLLKILTAK